MHGLHPELTLAMRAMMDKLHAVLVAGGYRDEPVQMYLAGGMAVHYYCGTRYTEDVDASFSRRMVLPYEQLTIDYLRQDQTPASLYLDPNYSDILAVLHPDYREDSGEWEGIGNESRLIHLRVLAPVDLAVSKISRFLPHDREDILALGHRRLFTTGLLQRRTVEALDYYVGDTRWINLNLQQVCEEIDVALAS